MKTWEYDEFRHCGTDYSDTAQAESYDSQHEKFRNYENEVTGMMRELALDNPGEMTVIDLGCGTGAFAITAAKYFRKIFAVDVSDAMIAQARKKADREKVTNVEFIRSGFLGYEYGAEPADMVISKVALHHLPDFWKQIALSRIGAMLGKGGIFYLFDVVFSFKPEEYAEKIDAWISDFGKIAGTTFRAEAEIHIRDEYSTFDWIMGGMIERAGFEIMKTRKANEFMIEYFCVKK